LNDNIEIDVPAVHVGCPSDGQVPVLVPRDLIVMLAIELGMISVLETSTERSHL